MYGRNTISKIEVSNLNNSELKQLKIDIDNEIEQRTEYVYYDESD
jgi:hypothetical protein